MQTFRSVEILCLLVCTILRVPIFFLDKIQRTFQQPFIDLSTAESCLVMQYIFIPDAPR